MEALHLKFVFNRLKELDTKPVAPVQLRITLRRKSSFVTTGFKLKKNQWDERRQIVKNHNDSVSFNLLMNRQKDKAFKFYMKLIEKGQYVESKDVANFLKGKTGDDFIAFVEKQFDDWALKLEFSTMKQHSTFLNKYLKGFKKIIPFESIGYGFVANFQTFLLKQDNYRSSKKGLHQNYINSMLSILRKYTNQALRLKLISVDPFTGFKIKRKPSVHRPLTLEELLAFENVDVSNRRGKIPLAKDMFLFGCWTGLRFSDMCLLKPSHIKESEKGLEIHKVLKKTKGTTRKSVNLPLYDFFGGKPEKLIKKRLSGEFVFGKYDNKSYNEAVRDLCRLANIAGYEEITGHDSRHTFGVLLGNMPGMTPPMLAFFMGHSSIETTMIYFKQNEQAAKDMVGKIDWSKYK